MSGGHAEINRDDTPFSTGTHKYPESSAFLNDPGKNFLSCGVQVGVLIKNTTDGSSSETTAVTEDTVTGVLSGGTNNYWANGDTYEIYRTDTEDSIISTVWVDKRYGRKTPKKDMHAGLRPEDEDLDEYTENVFGPGQPSRNRR